MSPLGQHRGHGSPRTTAHLRSRPLALLPEASSTPECRFSRTDLDGSPEAWQLEHDVCERVARQYRCVGGALAWRVFGFQRRHVIARCLNGPPGVMAGKAGLAAELARVKQAY